MRLAFYALLALSACAELDDPELAALDQELDNLPPGAKLTSPAAGSSVPAGTPIYLAATASDADGTIVKVEFFANGTKVGEDTSKPYTTMWLGGSVGTYELTARATDDAGAKTISKKVSFKLIANQPPVTYIAFPGVHFAYEPGDTIQVEAEAFDPDGAVTSVELYANDEKIALKFGGPPWTFAWTDVPEGTYRLSTRATDSAGGQSWSYLSPWVIVRSFDDGPCDAVPDYQPAHSYAWPDDVRAFGNRYVCIQVGPAGCSGPAEKVEPVRGWAWGTYWQHVSTCVPDICLGLPDYAPNVAYQPGDAVKEGSGRYACKSAAACSGPPVMYQPGSGSAWMTAWSWDPCQEIE
jgi:hypothetical protein